MMETVGIEEGNTSWKSRASRSWPRAPLHYRVTQGIFMVTSGTYLKERFFNDSRKLRMLERAFLEIAHKYEWHLQAWAFFQNHYHFVQAKEDNDNQTTLDNFMEELHGRTSRTVNKVDGTSGRKVWHNYWETALTFQASYYARLNYVHQNAVKHGLVAAASQYPYCSAAWFEATASNSDVATIYSFGTDRLDIPDDF